MVEELINKINYTQVDLHLEYRNSTGNNVKDTISNLENPYIKWLEEIAIAAKKQDLFDEKLKKEILEDMSSHSFIIDEEDDECHCGCGCHEEHVVPEEGWSKKLSLDNDITIAPV